LLITKVVDVLVPTTLLAQQHYQSFRDRFADWQEGDRIEAYKLVTQRRTLST
jgi:transcription-repair coupling factor (superfamily II helicase)